MSRSRHQSSTIFRGMTELAQASGSVNLRQGFPDTDGAIHRLTKFHA